MSCASDASSSNASQLLPFELLSEIMLLAVKTNSRVVDLNGRLNYTTRIGSVTRLSSVCSHWRNVALNVPQLWVLEYGDASGFPLSPQAQLFLDRSHPSTFSVSLHYSFMNRDWGHGSKPTIRALVSSKFRHTTKRWAYLSLTIRTKEELYDIAQLPRGGFQNLHHLHIQIDARIGENDVPLDVFADAPSLSTVFLGLDRLRQPAATFVPLPWPRLAQLSLELPAHRDVFDVVSRCPSLISLVLSIPNGPTDDDQAETTTRLEHLKNLVLRTTRKTKLAYMENYLAILDVPALQVLNLSCRVFHPDWFSDFIVPFETFHHRISSLTTFLLTRFPSNAPMTILLRMLRAMPELKELSLADFPECNLVFDALCHPSLVENETLLPRLESLMLTVDLADDQHLMKMVLSRWDTDAQLGISRLRRCRLQSWIAEPFVLSDVFMNEMARIKQEGFIWEYNT